MNKIDIISEHFPSYKHYTVIEENHVIEFKIIIQEQLFMKIAHTKIETKIKTLIQGMTVSLLNILGSENKY